MTTSLSALEDAMASLEGIGVHTLGWQLPVEGTPHGGPLTLVVGTSTACLPGTETLGLEALDRGCASNQA